MFERGIEDVVAEVVVVTVSLNVAFNQFELLRVIEIGDSPGRRHVSI
jgi:hypothetical protein